MTETTAPSPPWREPPRGFKIAFAIVAVLVLLVVGARLALLSPAGRALVVHMADGRTVGRFGRLHVQGLHGDVLSAFTLDRATLADAKGVWLEVDSLRLSWDPTALLRRSFRAETVTARTVKLIRRPELAPVTRPPGPMPVSVRIGRFATTLELDQGFSKQYGLWSAYGDLDMVRDGRKRGAVFGRSLTRPGDFLTLNFDAGGRDRLQASLQAREARGGPIAGALGYATDQPFLVDVHAAGAGPQGSFYAAATSGAFTPLRADGRWSDGGGEMKGVVAFAGSDLLKPFIDRLGPQARFDAAYQRRSDGRYALQWTLAADNLTSRGQGLVDPRPLGSRGGLRLSLATPSASRLLGRKLAGPASFDGVVTGTPADWRLDGTLSARQAGLDGYTVASASGPLQVQVRNGRIDGQGQLQGSGGAGRGMIAGLLGARPKAQLALTRLADGRLIVDRFDVDGADVVVRGAGSRGLTGAFRFEGKAEVPRVAGLRPGGRGALSATWRAAETGRGRPWSVDFTANGRAFATGLGQLDRLLGPAPRLTAGGTLQHGVVQLQKAALTGKAGAATGRGSVALNGKLDLKLDWTAQGPFQAGPVTLAGNARGSGTVTGALLSPKADLASHFDRIDLPDLALENAQVAMTFAKDPHGYDGAASVRAQSAYGPATAASRFAFTKTGLRLDQLAVDAGGVKAHGSLALNHAGPSDADLSFSAGPGAFLASGVAEGTVRLTSAAQTDAALQVSGSNLVFRNATFSITSLRLNGRGPLSHLPFSLSTTLGGSLPASFDGAGLYSRSGGAQTILLNGGGKVRGVGWRTLQPLTVALSPSGRTIRADLGVGGGRLTADARQDRSGFDARATVANLDMAALNQRLVGKVNGTAQASGRGAQLSGTLDGRLQSLRDADAPETGAVDAQVRAALANDQLRVDLSGRDTSGGNATADVALPVQASAAPLHLAIARTRPIAGRFALQGEAQPYWDLFVGGLDNLSGKITAQGTIGGTLASPAIVGTADVQGGRFQDARTGLDLQKLTLAARFDHETAVFDRFQGQDGHGGTVTGQGQVNLARGASSSFTLALHRFQLIDTDNVTARASGPVTVTRAPDGKIKLVGKLKLDRTAIAPNPPAPSGVVRMDVVELHRPAGRGQAFVPPPAGPAVELDIALNAPGQVLVQGRGLNLEFSLDAHVGGTTRDPELTGTADLVRGDFTFAGKRFDFDPNGTVTLGTHARDIRLNLRAEYNPPTGSLTAYVNVTGTAERPKITLTSTPSLPQDEILSQILFGSSASQLSTAQAAQIGAATASLTGGGGLDVLGNLREFAGLDVLTFGAEASSLTVTGGKYVGNNLYLEVVGGGRGGTSVQADWRVLKNLSVVSQLAGQGYSRISVYWRKDFH